MHSSSCNNKIGKFLMEEVTPPGGFPNHPQSASALIVAFDGGITHQDCASHKCTVGPGDVQWMIAGRGIIHPEMLT
ncbi:pirin-like protein 2 [Quercus suber]|uniref:Pirin-like protein 2 n=1 Tax=Quercus suber TaxID=58331 RepID=A0AAW0LS45_QUESU